MAEDATYPPLDVPKPMADGAWVVDGSPQHVLGLTFPIRMTVLRLADGGLWLHSPTRHTPALEAALAPLGPVRHLVAPNTAHWAHVSPWQKAFPNAKLWAAPGVVERARGQDVHLRAAGVLGDSPPADWDGQIEHAVFSGPGLIEVAFHHRASRTLVLTDVVQAMRSGDLPLATRLFSTVVGSAAPEGATPAHIKLVLNRRRPANRAAAERLLALGPERVVFAHGAFYVQDGAARLRRALDWLLRD
jgi:hypothetical protein